MKKEENMKYDLSDAQVEKAKKLWEDRCEKVKKLREFKPTILDLSLREASVATPTGPTRQDKIRLLELIHEMGFKNEDLLIGTLDYGLPDCNEPDDDFCKYLKDNNLHPPPHSFVFTWVGSVSNGNWQVPKSLEKMKDIGIPNTIMDVDISKESLKIIDPPQTRKNVLFALEKAIEWWRKHFPPKDEDGNLAPRIYINFRDCPDAYAEDHEWMMHVAKVVTEKHQVDGVAFEDPRGTFFHYDIYTITAMIRTVIPRETKLLVHLHSGNGTQNAGMLEAFLAGADGFWAGLPKEAATIGHVSGAEILANLVRVDNQNMKKYKMNRLMPITREMTQINMLRSIPDDYPIIGNHAYTSMLSVFDQKAGREMDLPPENIGTIYTHRIAALSSDEPVIKGRLAEIGISDCTTEVATKMRCLMRKDLQQGIKVEYNEEPFLRDLYDRAKREIAGENQSSS